MINIAFRADGSEQIGMGHIMRCMALAEELQKSPASIYFFTRENAKAIEKISEKEIRPIILRKAGTNEEIAEVIEYIEKFNINIFVTDSYDISEHYLEKIKKVVPLLVSIDDLNQLVYPSDIVINGNVYAEELQYSCKYGNTRFLLGSRYALMRKEFLNIPIRKIRKQVKNILVTVGGSDVFNLTPQILEVFAIFKRKLRITVVIGPNFLNTDKIVATVSKIHHEIIIVENVNNMRELMLENDLAITAGGTTLYELAITGTPAIVILQAENQLLAAQKLDEKGTILNLGMGNRDFSQFLTEAFAILNENFINREKMSYRGQRLVDGQGCGRCAKIIVSSLKKLKFR